MTSSSNIKGVVAAGHHLTAQAAKDILLKGGNAFDAVIAGLAMCCVVEPVLMSPGGGGFLMAHDVSRGQSELIDFFVQTPLSKRAEAEIDFAGITADFGPGTQEFHIGHGSTATPGFVPGIFAIHDRHASLPMAELLAPAIKAARDGFVLSALHEYIFSIVAPIYTATPEARALFAPNGEKLKQGARFKNPGLAEFFRGLSEDGLAFYDKGAGFEAMVQTQNAQGHLTKEDFETYEIVARAPLEVQFRNAKVLLNTPPSAGGAFIAGALKQYEKEEKAPITERIFQALKHTDEIRLKLKSDPVKMLNHFDIKTLSSPKGPAAYRGTTHISIIDAMGNMASATGSNGEGNGHMVGEFGFMLNNMLGEEDLNPGGFHLWPENVRLSSMMCPTLATCPKRGLLALGSGGSNRIRSAIFQTLVRSLCQNLSAQDAVSAPRIHYEDGFLNMETGFIERLPEEVSGYKIWPEINIFYGGVHMVRRMVDGSYTGFGDPRREGVWLTA